MPRQAGALVQGRVLAEGTPRANAEVQLLAWPSEAVLEGLAEGATVPMQTVATVRTDSQGRWSVGGRQLRADRYDQADAVDLTAVIRSGTESVVYDFPASRPSAADPAVDGRGRHRERPNLEVDVAGQVVTDRSVEGSTPQRTGVVTTSVPGAELVASDGGGPDNVVTAGCGATSAGSIVYGLPEYFLNVYSWVGNPATVTQDVGSSHVLGVGLKNSSGTWSASGSSSMTYSSGARDTMDRVYDDRVWNKVNYRDYVMACVGTYRRPYSFHTLGYQLTAAGDINFSYGCYRKTSGTFTKSSGTNVTYSAGVDIGPINVSAQSGYNVDTYFTLTGFSTYPGTICANSSVGAVTASQISVKQ